MLLSRTSVQNYQTSGSTVLAVGGEGNGNRRFGWRKRLRTVGRGTAATRRRGYERRIGDFASSADEAPANRCRAPSLRATGL